MNSIEWSRQSRQMEGGQFRVQTMMKVSFLTISTLALVLILLFVAHYLMLWPFQSRLEVDDPVISEWLKQDGVVIYRTGETLADSRMYITEGERIEGGCSWHFSVSGSDDYVIVSRELATNHLTCETLVEEGRRVD